MTKRARMLLPIVLLACGGCYTYRPAALESLRSGVPVRARLSSAGAEGVSQLTGSLERTLDARFILSDADSVVLEVWRTDIAAERAFTPGRLRIPVRRTYIEDVAQKRLSYARTGVLAAVIAAGSYQLYRMVWDRAGGTPDGGGSQGPAITINPGR